MTAITISGCVKIVRDIVPEEGVHNGVWSANTVMFNDGQHIFQGSTKVSGPKETDWATVLVEVDKAGNIRLK